MARPSAAMFVSLLIGTFIGTTWAAACRGGVCLDAKVMKEKARQGGTAGQLSGFGSTPVDFYGFEGEMYNLLTEKQHQVNAEFSNIGGNALVVTRVGIQNHMNGVTSFVQASTGRGVTGKGLMHLEVNGQVLDSFTELSDESMLLTITTKNNVKLVYQRAADSSETVKVSTGFFSFYIRKPGGGVNFILDISAKEVDPNLEVHGVLGQTFACSSSADAAIREACGKLVGDESEYRVSHVYGLDFKHNLFRPDEE